MSGIDFIVCGLFAAGILIGLVRGLLGALFDLLAFSVALAVASYAYPAPLRLFTQFNVTGNAVELLCYIVATVVIFAVVVTLLELLRRRRADDRGPLDKAAGAVLGIATGVLLAGTMAVFLSVSPGAAGELNDSRLVAPLVRALPRFYTGVERHGVSPVKVLLLTRTYDEGELKDVRAVKFQRFSYAKLDGSTCMECGGKAAFRGYEQGLGAAILPLFVCAQCGRKSEGCQTYEGFHHLYATCPVTLAAGGLFFDCMRFPNHKWIVPPGPCPVDATRLPPRVWRPPIVWTPTRKPQ